MGNYHTDEKCKNCVLNGGCLIDDSDVEDCDEQEDEDEETKTNKQQ